MDNRLFLTWTKDLQSIAQAGLYYGKDVFDRERYEKIREISAQMMSEISDLDVGKVKDLFCNEIGYQTPKIDTRSAIFKNDRILLVREKNGTWSLPGGWCDYNVSVAENAVKETREESGFDVKVIRLIAVQDRAKHNSPLYPYGVCKMFLNVLSQEESLKKTVKQQRLTFLQRTRFQTLPQKRTIKNS